MPPPGELGYEEYYAQAGADPSDYFVPHSTGFTRRLSTISEKTEKTEQTRTSRHTGGWPTRQELLSSRRPPSTPTTSSYGQVLHPSASTFKLGHRSSADDEIRSVGTSSQDYGQVIGEHKSFFAFSEAPDLRASCTSLSK